LTGADIIAKGETGPRVPRIALLGAFPWSSPQGSQVFVREQARALARAGARVAIVSYGRGPLPAPPDLPWRPLRPDLSPRGWRSGPSLAKAIADAALLLHWLTTARRERFDAVLAHNVEAAAIALVARRWTRIPVVYVAHTLLSHELSTYGPSAFGRQLDAVGSAIDRAVARRADAVIALDETARKTLACHARGPVVWLPPGHLGAPPPDEESRRAACRLCGVEVGRFALYAGNLDAYQGLDRLEDAARWLAARGIPVVVATHDPGAATRSPGSPLRLRTVADVGELRALVWAAGVLVLPRRVPGGFPIKLLNYLESGRPIVACAGAGGGLLDGESGVVLPDDASGERLGEAVGALFADPERAGRLGAAGPPLLARRHDWTGLAAATLDLVAEVCGASAG